jgi:undecaprenyl-diphosphatase
LVNKTKLYKKEALHLENLDNNIFRLINNLAGHVHLLDDFFIIIAKDCPVFLGLFFIAFWFLHSQTIKKQQQLPLAVVSLLIAELFAKIAGQFYAHHQPFAVLPHVNKLITKSIDNSFPSDHTLLFFATLMLMMLLSTGRFRYLYLVVSILVGISRIWVGVHYPIDILFGAIFGIISSLFVVYFLTDNHFILAITKFFSDKLYIPTARRARHARK